MSLGKFLKTLLVGLKTEMTCPKTLTGCVNKVYTKKLLRAWQENWAV